MSLRAHHISNVWNTHICYKLYCCAEAHLTSVTIASHHPTPTVYIDPTSSGVCTDGLFIEVGKPFAINIRPDLTVDIGELFEICDCEVPPGLSRKWADDLVDCGDFLEDDFMPLTWVFQWSLKSASPCRRLFHKQLLWGVARLVEDVLQTGESSAIEALDLSVRGEGTLSASVHKQHYNNGICAVLHREQPLFMSCAPDKSRVHSMGLGSTAFAIPGNTGWWGAPQDQCRDISDKSHL